MSLNYYETAWFGMGTVIEQKVEVHSVSEGKDICRKVSEVIKELEHKMSYFIPESFVGQLNSSNGGAPVKMDSDTFHVLKTAAEYYRLSNGAFDITAAPLTALWRDGINDQILPLRSAIQRLAPWVSGASIVLDEKNKSARIGKNQSIDLGGIAKGYAADMALKACRSYGVNSAFINLGGNVHTLGKKTNGEPWMIGLQDPRSKRGDFIAALAVSNKSAVTSGDYEKYFEYEGKRYHHIIDPKTGYPANSDLMSATVVSSSSMEADALSTAVFVSGLERGMELIKKSPEAEGVLITKDQKVFVTKGLSECFVAQSNIKNYKFYFYD